MIARDEAALIASCLESVRHLVREMIVVDTGSTDGTAEVAARHGARVFAFPWQDDFAAARNHALARATGDWILVLDADEVLEPVSAGELAGLLAAPGVEGYFVTIRNYLGQGEEAYEDRAVRLFRNRPQYRFEGTIHEQIAGTIRRHNGGGGLALSPLVISHFGYLDDHLRTKGKYRRNVRILERALAERPDDPFLLFCLGLEHLRHGETAGGLAPLEKALAFAREDEGYFRDLFLALCLALLKAGQRDRLKLLLDRAPAVMPGDPDLFLIRGVLSLTEGRPAAAVGELRRALDGGAQLLPAHRLHALLGDALSLLGWYEEAEGEYFRALVLAPRNLHPLARILALKGAGKGRLSWAQLARFATPAEKRFLAREAKRLGEAPLALALLLLTLLEAPETNRAAELVADCRWLEALAGEAKVLIPGHETAAACLACGAQEMLLCAEAVRRGWGCTFFPALERLSALACTMLDLVTTGSETDIQGERTGCQK
jgi:tetratricopeptide (TPR) repeat protein